MSASLWSIWNTVARLGLAKPTTAELALADPAGQLCCSACAPSARTISKFGSWVGRHSSLSRLAEHCFAAKIPAPFDVVAVQATFVLAVGLLAGAVLLYTRGRDLILPLMVITPGLGRFRRGPNPAVA